MHVLDFMTGVICVPRNNQSSEGQPEAAFEVKYTCRISVVIIRRVKASQERYDLAEKHNFFPALLVRTLNDFIQ